MLEEQEAHDEFTDLDVRFINDNVKRLYIWDVAGHEWSVSRTDMKQLVAMPRNMAPNRPIELDCGMCHNLSYGQAVRHQVAARA
jgi:hypothetical protein